MIDPAWYPLFRAIHVSAALASGALFALRGIAMWQGSEVGMRGAVRYASYCIDTVLLCAAIALAVLTHRVPLDDPWVTVKIGLVVLYIVLGSLALKRAPTIAWQRVAYVAALSVFAAIYWLARHRF